MTDGDPSKPKSSRDEGNSAVNTVGRSDGINPFPRAGDVVVDQADEALVKAQQAQASIEHGQQDILDRIKTGERWMIFFTAIVAFTTVAQVIQSGCNNASTSKQVDKIIGAANIQASAASNIATSADRFSISAEGIKSQTVEAVGQFKRLAESTETGLKQARESFRNEQRAWVGVHPKDIDFSSSPPTAGLILTNTGRTPAFKVVQHVNALSNYCCWNKSERRRFERPKVLESPHKGTLAPDSFISLTYDVGIMQQMVSINGGRQTEIVSGKVTYDDAYGRHHFTNYCFYYTISLPGTPATSKAATFCSYGNDTDDDPEPLPSDGSLVEYPYP